jgi:hypothetical protein
VGNDFRPAVLVQLGGNSLPVRELPQSSPFLKGVGGICSFPRGSVGTRE